MIYLLGASIALNVVLLIKWRIARIHAAAAIFHMTKKYGPQLRSELAESEKEMLKQMSLWDKLFR